MSASPALNINTDLFIDLDDDLSEETLDKVTKWFQSEHAADKPKCLHGRCHLCQSEEQKTIASFITII